MANPPGTGPGAAAGRENRVSPGRFTASPPLVLPTLCVFNTFKIAVINQRWQIRRGYAEIVGVGWVIVYFTCAW